MTSEGKKRLPVYWNGQLVGHIVDPYVDNFHLYGDWKPEDSDIADEFVNALFLIDQQDGEPLRIGIGEVEAKFTVQYPPEEQFDAEFQP